MTKPDISENRYKALVKKIFFDRYKKGATELAFARKDLESAAEELDIVLPKNLGDVIYSIRYRTPMPEEVLATQPKGTEWIVEGVGRALYAFKLVRVNRIIPNAALVEVKIPTLRLK